MALYSNDPAGKKILSGRVFCVDTIPACGSMPFMNTTTQLPVATEKPSFNICASCMTPRGAEAQSLRFEGMDLSTEEKALAAFKACPIILPKGVWGKYWSLTLTLTKREWIAGDYVRTVIAERKSDQ